MAITAASSINRAGVVWSYAVGSATQVDDDDDDEDLSERFVPMMQASNRRSSAISNQNQNKTSAIWSYDAGEEDEDEALSECFALLRAPSLNEEAAKSQPSTIDETTDCSSSSSDNESTSTPPPPPPSSFVSPKPTRHAGHWDETRMTPCALLTKMMPDKVKKAQEKLLTKSLTPLGRRTIASKKLSRSECRSAVQSSFCKLDSHSNLPTLNLSHESAPVLMPRGDRLGTRKGNKKESNLMSMLRADLQPKSDKTKSKHKSSSSSSSSSSKSKKSKEERSKSPKRSSKDGDSPKLPKRKSKDGKPKSPKRKTSSKKITPPPLSESSTAIA